MNVRKSLILLICAFPLILFGQNKKQFQIKYISLENIYLNGGRSDGLVIGDTLAVKSGDKLIAAIEVQFLSEHSASCTVIKSIKKITTTDMATLISRHRQKKVSEPSKEKSRHRIFAQTRHKKIRRQKFADISGSVSFQWFRIEDLQSSHLGFDQPTLRANIKMRKIGGKNYNLNIRTRSRYYQRSRNYSMHVPRKDWQNRIYQVSLSYDDEKAVLNYQFGRIISNKFSGIGYIDGALLQTNLTRQIHLGVFAGTQPEWRKSNFQTSLQKYGGYFNFVKGDYRRFRFESTWAFAGEYHGSTVSREFFYVQNNLYSNRKFSFYQSAELDINRKWRKEKTNQSISLTSFYLSANFNMSDHISTSLSYDNRKNYWTYETQSLADSLFDDAFRQGLRAHLNLKLSSTFYAFANFGARKRQNDNQSTFSYAAGLNSNNIFNKNIYINFHYSGFSNYYANGMNPSLTLGKNFAKGHNVSIDYGNYRYKLKSNSSDRANQWLRVDGFLELWYNFYFFGQFEYNWGKDSTDRRLLGELGYRF